MIEKGIAVIGSTTIDKIVHRNFSRVKIGGVTAYSGITYSRHGIKTRVLTNVASSDRQVIERLKQESIIVCNGRTESTTYFRNLLDEGDENRRQHMLQQAAPISRSHLVKNLEDAGIVHLGPLHPSDIDVQAIECIGSFKPLVTLDIQGLLRTIDNTTVYPAVSEHLPAALQAAHIVKANRQEYETLMAFFRTGLTQLAARFKIREFVVTTGDNGGFVQTIAGEEIPYAATGLKSNEDPTGAGDVFLAAYVIDRFLNRRPIADACQYAAALAARQIEGNYIKPDDLAVGNWKKYCF